ncbi:hypothetical protein RhiirA4_465830 [Rhizophagus irregularis]|uniref:Uncharacterized protein n=1 Tax=Rhizophagus irregularis TaxID=588596 RepID=A0A2I1GT55_9GLOM|nr:hypothetical protein RhiirA4_465830 [Rhizophagus irregularis]
MFRDNNNIFYAIIIVINSLFILIGNIFYWFEAKGNEELGTILIVLLYHLIASVLMIISGVVTVTSKTLNHKIIYYIMNVIFIIYKLVTITYALNIHDYKWFVGLNVVFLFCLIILDILHSKCCKRCAATDANNSDLKTSEIYKWYYWQKTLCHAQIIVAIFLLFIYSSISLEYGYNVESPIDLFTKFIPWPIVLLCLIILTMIKGVRTESLCIMVCFYIASLSLCGYYIYAIIKLCDLILKHKQDYDYIQELKLEISLSVISFFITIITMINSAICIKKYFKRFNNKDDGFEKHLLKKEHEKVGTGSWTSISAWKSGMGRAPGLQFRPGSLEWIGSWTLISAWNSGMGQAPGLQFQPGTLELDELLDFNFGLKFWNGIGSWTSISAWNSGMVSTGGDSYAADNGIKHYGITQDPETKKVITNMDVALESIIPSRSKNFEKQIIVIFMVTSQTTMMNGNHGKLIVILKELDASSKEEKQEEITLPLLPHQRYIVAITRSLRSHSNQGLSFTAIEYWILE